MANKIKKMINDGIEYKIGSIDSSNDTYENIIHLSQEEYDALETKDPDTLYSTPDNATEESLFVIGEIKIFSGTTIPDKFLECDGSALSTSAYPELFAVIGYTYGGSEGIFNLPNLNGKVITGFDSSDACFCCMGCTGGEKTHTLTVDEIPEHCHCIVEGGGGGAYEYHNSFQYATSRCNANYKTSCAGGGCAHNNLQPYITLKYIIRCK